MMEVLKKVADLEALTRREMKTRTIQLSLLSQRNISSKLLLRDQRE